MNFDVVHWNNGHWDYSDLFGDGPFNLVENYVANMERIARILKGLGKRIIFATTTPLGCGHPQQNDGIVEKYNDAVVPRLEKMGIEINDLYSFVEPHIDEYIRKDDNIHLTQAGIDACAKRVAEIIKL